MGEVVYLDSSALIKLVFEEAGSDALSAMLHARPARVSSVLARVEVMRAAATVEDRSVIQQARTVLAGVNLILPDDRILSAAITCNPPELRSLDAIHLATALSLGHRVAGMFVYDRRLADAARHHGLTVWAPA